MEELNDPIVAEIIPLAFSDAEIEWCESNFPAMAADQPENFCSLFESAAAVCQMELLPSVLTLLRNDFQCAAKWHEAFNRPELAAKYQRIAAVCHKVLTEKLN